MLLTHLYSYFGVLLGCSTVGANGTGSAYPAYAGDKSMYETHKYMGLGAFEFGYFVEQVGLAAASFGVADADVTAVGMALNSLFGYKCAPAATVVPSQGDALQAICIEVRFFQPCSYLVMPKLTTSNTVQLPNSTKRRLLRVRRHRG